jgi:hypothetical protein
VFTEERLAPLTNVMVFFQRRGRYARVGAVGGEAGIVGSGRFGSMTRSGEGGNRLLCGRVCFLVILLASWNGA